MKTARVTVQFQSVTEKLSPHDTIFSFAQSSDLRDTAFSSACSLHTATASIKSSNDSLTQRGLAEITEDASESRIDSVESGVVHDGTAIDEEQFPGAEDKDSRSTSADIIHHRSASTTTQGSFRPRNTSNTDKPLPPPPGDHTHEKTDPVSVPDYGDYRTRPSMEGRFSSNSTRPSTRDLYDAYGYKTKTKLGPRPSIDSGGAPNEIDSRANDYRPVSTLPAGLRMPTRKAVPTRPASRQARPSPSTQTSPPPGLSSTNQATSSDMLTPKMTPAAPVASNHILDRGFPTPNHGLRTIRIPESGPPKMTPEKQRLMKALQLRQKQIAAQSSISGLEIKSVSEEPEFTKPYIDESILSAVIDASESAERPEPVQITTKDIIKDSRHLEDSPISIPETAEAPSTQASSITDEEEAVAQKRQENHLNSIATLSEHQGLLYDDSSHNRSTSSQEVAPEYFEKNALTKAASTENLENPSKPCARTESHFFLADKDEAEQKAVGKALTKSGQHDQSAVIGGQSQHEESILRNEAGGDQQLSPSLILDGQAPKDQSTSDDVPPVIDWGVISKAGIDENRGFPQGELHEVHQEGTFVGEVFEKDNALQSQPLGDELKVYFTPTTDVHTHNLQGQNEEVNRESLEHRAQASNDVVLPRELQNDIVKPLLVRRSSSSKSISIPSDCVNAHEVPLPPIDEDEEISLSPQRALFDEQIATHPPLNTDGDLKEATAHAKPPFQDSDHSVTQSPTSNIVGERQTERQIRERGMSNPIKRVSSPDHSDEHFLSDDAFMEELKSATVQEAKPVSVSKSPIKPVFSRSESEQRLNGSARDSRSVSTPADHPTKDEEVFSSPLPTPPSTSRSFSAQHPRSDSQSSQVPIPKKIGVSSSISQRIKALEQLSSRPKSPISPNLAPNTTTFLGLRKASLRNPSGGADYKNNDFNNSRSGKAYPSPSPSPEPVKSSVHRVPNKADRSRPIMSASAAMVCEASEKSPEILNRLSAPRHLDLQDNPLQGEHLKSPPPAERKTMGPPPLSPLKPPRPRFGRYSSTRSGSSSSNEQKLEPPPNARRDSFASVRSKSSRAGSEVELPRNISDSSLSGVASLDGTQDEKKDSRRSRLLKRMSSISSMSRRSIAHALSPGPKEAPIIERQEPVQEAPSTSVDIGDVNVQFPDNLVSSAIRLLPTLADEICSFGRDDIWSLTHTAF